MQFNLKKSFNDFLDTNLFVNQYESTRSVLKKYKKGSTLYLLSILFMGSTLTILLDFITSVIGYNNPIGYLGCSIFLYVFCILMNNLIFYAFVRCVRHEKLKMEDLKNTIRLMFVQVVCAIMVSLVQNFFLTAGVTIFSFNIRLSVIVNIIISWVFTIFNALVAFQIYDNKKGIKNIFIKAYDILWDNWKVLLMISILFLSWKFISSIAFTDIVASEIVQVQNINNIFHTLLFSKNYVMLTNVIIFNVVNFIVSGYLEISFLIPLAHFYDIEESKKINRR